MNFRQLQTTGYRATRARLGLSQRKMAEQLGISNSTLAMAETGRRNLPTPALIKMAQLEIKIAGLQLMETSIKQDEITSSPTMPLPHASISICEMEFELRIHKLSRALESMTARYQQIRVQIQVMDGILASEPAVFTNPSTMAFQWNRERLRQQLEKYCPVKQQLLRNQLALLKAEAHLNKGLQQQLG